MAQKTPRQADRHGIVNPPEKRHEIRHEVDRDYDVGDGGDDQGFFPPGHLWVAQVAQRPSHPAEKAEPRSWPRPRRFCLFKTLPGASGSIEPPAEAVAVVGGRSLLDRFFRERGPAPTAERALRQFAAMGTEHHPTVTSNQDSPQLKPKPKLNVTPNTRGYLPAMSFSRSRASFLSPWGSATSSFGSAGMSMAC